MIDTSRLKVTGIKIAPVARVFAILYFVFGLAYFFIVSLQHAERITFPLGILAPFIGFNINLSFIRFTDVPGAALQMICCLVTYSVTGWITGAVLILCFNLVAKQLGGLTAQCFSIESHHADVAASRIMDNPR